MDYSFFFDETFHDRKITISPKGTINTMSENKNDSYIGIFWGCEKYRLPVATEKLAAVEKKYIERFGLTDQQEFKSTNISRKHFKNGVRSFVPNTLDFYNDFFSAMTEIGPILHINVLSKMEYFVRTIFPFVSYQYPGVIDKVFYYTMAKFMVNYHTPELVKAMYSAAESGNGEIFKKELLHHIRSVIKADRGIIRKEKELALYRQFMDVLRNYRFYEKIEFKYDFIYEQNFSGLMQLLEEKNIPSKKVFLTIDQEEETAKAANRYRFKRIEQKVSDESIAVRIADHLCGFVGRMMYALTNDSEFKEDVISSVEDIGKGENFSKKHLLGSEWFNLKEKHFELYQLLYKVFIEQQLGCYWATMTSSYADQTTMFYALLRYFSSYKTYDDYQKVSAEVHAERYNSACCYELSQYYRQLEQH